MKKNQFLILMISAATISGSLIFSTSFAEARIKEKTPDSIEKNEPGNNKPSIGGTAVLGGFFAGCIYLLSRTPKSKSTDVDEATANEELKFTSVREVEQVEQELEEVNNQN